MKGVVDFGHAHFRNSLCNNMITMDGIHLGSSPTVGNLGVISEEDLTF